MDKVHLRRQGQALLLVVITLAVVMTVVLSVAARSVTDIQISTSEEESLRAFSAAEAGVEKALITGFSDGQNTLTDSGDLSNATFEAEVTNFAQNLTSFNYPLEIISGDTATVWFVSHDDNNDLVCDAASGLPCFTGTALRVCWGEPGTPNNNATTPAIQVDIFYDPTPSGNGSYTDLTVTHAAFDPNAGRRAVNSFAQPDAGNCNINGKVYEFQEDIAFSSLGIPVGVTSSQNGLIIGRVKMFYNTTVAQSVGFSVTGGSLPGQGRQVESTGRSGESTRKVQVYTLYPGFPSVFDSAVFSPLAITK